MYDINFFSVYKKKQSKNNGYKIFALGFLSLFILVSILLIIGGSLYFASLENSINEKTAIINSEETKTKIAEANKIKIESALTTEYLSLLKSATDKLTQINTLNSALLDKVRNLTPANTRFTQADYTGRMINLGCVSTLVTDPMDMYHAFKSDKTFASVTLYNIDIAADGSVQFSIDCQLAGGEIK